MFFSNEVDTPSFKSTNIANYLKKYINIHNNTRTYKQILKIYGNLPSFPKVIIKLFITSSLLTFPLLGQNGPRITVVPAPKNPFNLQKTTSYPWRKSITATVFWIGEKRGFGSCTIFLLWPRPNCKQ